MKSNRHDHAFHEKRVDYGIIVDIIPDNARVLDLGCGNGDLLRLLVDRKKVSGFGVDADEDKIIACVSKGLSVHHGDLETVLSEYPDNTFDFVILSLTLQSVMSPSEVIRQMLHVGKKAIVSFPNFAYLPIRFQLAVKGRMPKTKVLPYDWYNTPNIHHTTINDFADYCAENGISIDKAFYLGTNNPVKLLPNLFAYEALFVLNRP